MLVLGPASLKQSQLTWARCQQRQFDMPNDSSTGGYLAPASSPEYDAALDRILQSTVVGIVGIAGTLVRPRWQPIVPNMPEPEVNWAAIGVTMIAPDVYSYKKHDPADEGSLLLEQDEVISALVSFYGPASMSNCRKYRDGLEVSQNREALNNSGITLTVVGDAVSVPVLMAQKWQRRVDVDVTFRRRTLRSYQELTITSGQAGLVTEERGTIPINSIQ